MHTSKSLHDVGFARSIPPIDDHENQRMHRIQTNDKVLAVITKSG